MESSDYSPSAINHRFWLNYLCLVAISLASIFNSRFVNFVVALGESRWLGGTVISCGVAGAIVFRLMLGRRIDHWGTRWARVVSGLLTGAGFLFLAGATKMSAWIYVGSFLSMAGIAGAKTCTTVYMYGSTPRETRAATLALLGSAGFASLAIGSVASDFVFSSGQQHGNSFSRLYLCAAMLAVTSAMLALLADDGSSKVPRIIADASIQGKQQGIPWLLIALLFVCAGLQGSMQTYLTVVMKERLISTTAPFFVSYALSALLLRFFVPKILWQDARRVLINAGIICLCLSALLLTRAYAVRSFVFSGVLFGIGTALILPCIIAAIADYTHRFGKSGSGISMAGAIDDFSVMFFVPCSGFLADLGGTSALYWSLCLVGLGTLLIFNLNYRPGIINPLLDTKD